MKLHHKLTAVLCGLLAILTMGAGRKISDFTETLEPADAWLYEIAVPGVTNYKVTFGTMATNILARSTNVIINSQGNLSFNTTNDTLQILDTTGAYAGQIKLNAQSLIQFANSTRLGFGVAGNTNWYINDDGGGDFGHWKPTLSNTYNVASTTQSVKKIWVNDVSLLGVTKARPLFLDSVGNITNVTGTPNGSLFVRDDGVLAAPPGGGVSATNANQFGANTTLTIKDGALFTNLVVKSASNAVLALTVDTNVLIVSGGNVKLMPTPTATNGVLWLGIGGLENSSEPKIIVSELLTNGITGNPHSFLDVSRMNRTTALQAMASFDASVTFEGAGLYDHYAAHKSRFFWQGSGAIRSYYGLYVDLNTTGATGPLTNAYRVYLGEDMGSSGTIKTNYGVYVETLSSGMNDNWAVYTAASTKSYFGGKVSLGGTTSEQSLNIEGSSPLIVWHSATTGTTTGDGAFVGFIAGEGDFRIWNREASNIVFAVGNSERMRLNDTLLSLPSGVKLNLGKTTPVQTVSIYASQPIMEFQSPTTGDTSADGTFMGIVVSEVDFRIWNRESGNILFGTSGLERARIDANGNVGMFGHVMVASNLWVTGTLSAPSLSVVDFFVNTLNLTNALTSNQVRIGVEDLTNSAAASPTDGQLLAWDNGMQKWTNRTPDSFASTTQMVAGAIGTLHVTNKVGIGVIPTNSALEVLPTLSGAGSVRVNDTNGTRRLTVDVLPGSTAFGTLWMGDITPSAANYVLTSEGANTSINGTTINLNAAGLVRWQVSASGHLLAGTDGTKNIGANTTGRPLDAFLKGSIATYRSNLIASASIGIGVSGTNWTNSAVFTALTNNVTVYLDASTATTVVTLSKNGQQIADSIENSMATVMLKPDEYITVVYSGTAPTARWESW